ncbi:MAG: heavy-metal-associated domain-containing protein [Pirellula sp.]|nr:heavy-metal-associated domain-containing protein [Pirellula sp.]
MKTKIAGRNIGGLKSRLRTFSVLAPVLSACVVSTGCAPDSSPVSTSTNITPASGYISNAVVEATNESAVSEVGVRIDTMMCVEGCFNGVKELLEKRPGIEEVRLAPQKEEGTIDNSMVYIKHRGELDKAEMERLILGAGFDKIEFVK